MLTFVAVSAIPASLDDLIAEHATWLAIERGLRPNTLLAYRRDLRTYVTYLRTREIEDANDIEPRVVNDFVSWLRDARTDDGQARWSASSMARNIVAVRSFHQFCASEALLPTDPADDLQGPRAPAGIPKALSEPEVEALLGAIAGDTSIATRDRTILEMLYASGMRISELVGLDRADLDLDAGLVRVFGKGAKERIVPIGRTAVGAISDYLQRARPALTGNAAAARRAGDAVFLNARGGRLTRQGAWAIVRQAATRIGLADRVSPHVLRHSCATHMVDHGADIRVVQEVLGHASVSTTQVYTKVSPERLRAVYDSAHPRARGG